MINGVEIKMIALDLDGTTLDSNKIITPRTIKAFEDSMKKGVHIVISTGRTFNSLPKQLFDIKGLEYVITSNGAHITKLHSREKIFESFIPVSSVKKIIEVMSDTDYSVETFVGGRAYISESELRELLGKGSLYRDVEYVTSTRNPVDNIYKFMRSNAEHIENISINFPEEEDKLKIKSLLSQIDDITVTSSFSHNFEIGGKDTSKGHALIHLMDMVGVEKKNLLACGDSPNDGEMIRIAEVGVVMDNADDEMKKIADYITASNNADGVAKAIERYVL